jgi:hypothetical protein
MLLLSCVNCCHNPLQTDALGTSVGFCTEHRRVLLAPGQVTCGRHLRKDLPAERAVQLRKKHEAQYTPSAVVRLDKPTTPANGGYTSVDKPDVRSLEHDGVADAVMDYGRLDSKIGSLAQLRALPGVRAEVARLSLSRAYVNRCMVRGGKWTSGVHLLWWTRRRLLDRPVVSVDDIRVESPLPLARQVELAEWSLVMFRLIFVSDVGFYAGKKDTVGRLATLAETAAAATGELSARRLLAWLKRDGVKLIDAALPEKRYEALADELRRAHADTD